MKLAVVTGQIVCTVRHHGLAHDKLLMVEMIDPQGNPDGQCAVAIDNIGAGSGARKTRKRFTINAKTRTYECVAEVKHRNVTGRSVRDWHCR